MKIFAKIQWERATLFIVGLAFLAFALIKINGGDLATASGSALIGLLCLAFSNLARFKKFKGLGFEAELWEEKQQEAADLIDLFKTYTDEIVMGSVMSGRLGGNGSDWSSRWKLFNSLTGSKPVAGVTFDFSDLRKRVEDVFLFDMSAKFGEAIRTSLNEGRQAAAKIIHEEFGGAISDVDAYTARVKQNDVPTWFDNPFEIAKTDNLARRMLELAEQSSAALQTHFGVTVTFDTDKMARLRRIAQIADNRPVTVTDELIEWADMR